MFRVEFAVHLTYERGITTFRREDQLPFAPFIGLDVLDDILGQYTVEHVAWYGGGQMFLCQGSVERTWWNLRTACRKMATAQWEEDKEVRRKE